MALSSPQINKLASLLRPLAVARSCKGRNQLFEMMKRGGADRLENVVLPQGSDVAHHPAIGPGRGR